MEIMYHFSGQKGFLSFFSMSFHNKITKETKDRKNISQPNKGCMSQPVGKIILTMEKLEMFPLQSCMRHYYNGLENVPRTLREEENVKEYK